MSCGASTAYRAGDSSPDDHCLHERPAVRARPLLPARRWARRSICLKYTSKLTSNLVDRGRTKSPMCDHLPTDDANLGHRREREVVRERHHDVARVLREALDARQEGDRARHLRGASSVRTASKSKKKPATTAGRRDRTVEAESMPMMPTMAARPLRISHLRPRSFCSAVRFVVKLKGSQRLNRKWPPGPPLPLISG